MCISVEESRLKKKEDIITIILPPLLEYLPNLGLGKLKQIPENGNAFRSRWKVLVPLSPKEAPRADEEEAREDSGSQRVSL